MDLTVPDVDTASDRAVAFGATLVGPVSAVTPPPDLAGIPDGTPLPETGARCGVTVRVVRSWMADDPVAGERLGRTDLTVAWLRDAYLDEGRTATEIADQAGVTRQQVTQWLAEYGITRPPRSEQR